MSVRKFLGGGWVGLSRKSAGPPNPRPKCQPRPKADPSHTAVSVRFEVDSSLVYLIEADGNRIPLFESGRVLRTPSGLDYQLRQAIITVMQDLEPADNGVC